LPALNCAECLELSNNLKQSSEIKTCRRLPLDKVTPQLRIVAFRQPRYCDKLSPNALQPSRHRHQCLTLKPLQALALVHVKVLATYVDGRR
jgi:hypothetical protein